MTPKQRVLRGEKKGASVEQGRGTWGEGRVIACLFHDPSLNQATRDCLQYYRQLKVWQKAMDLAEQCYQVTRAYPKEELFGLTSQIRRAAVSVPANIAEGHGRYHTKEFLNHLSMARGSLMEVETHLQLSQRVGLLDAAAVDSLLTLTDEISRMLSGLRQSLEAKLNKEDGGVGE
jgi:four helix bundle protein